jgi:hypothetical protein
MPVRTANALAISQHMTIWKADMSDPFGKGRTASAGLVETASGGAGDPHGPHAELLDDAVTADDDQGGDGVRHSAHQCLTSGCMLAASVSRSAIRSCSSSRVRFEVELKVMATVESPWPGVVR